MTAIVQPAPGALLNVERARALLEQARSVSANFNAGRGGMFFAYDGLRVLATLDEVMRFAA